MRSSSSGSKKLTQKIYKKVISENLRFNTKTDIKTIQ